MIRPAALLLLLLALGGCGGGAREARAPEDEVLTGLAQSATRALELDQPESAARLYARALTRARERDDAALIADMAFGQATAALAHGDAAGALGVAQEVAADLARRGAAAPPRLTLVEAAALHRLGRLAEAGARAEEVARRGAEDPAAARRAAFLLGLLAAGRGDLPRLEAARAALAGAEGAAFRADALELAGQAALLRGEARQAAAEAVAAAALRRAAIDYRGLSRALALEAASRARLGETVAAADLLLRAGQGAAERGERGDAGRWLAEAETLAGRAGRPALVAEARRSARALREEAATTTVDPPTATGAAVRAAAAAGGGPSRRPRAQVVMRPRSQSRSAARASPAATRSR